MISRPALLGRLSGAVYHKCTKAVPKCTSFINLHGSLNLDSQHATFKSLKHWRFQKQCSNHWFNSSVNIRQLNFGQQEEAHQTCDSCCQGMPWSWTIDDHLARVRTVTATCHQETVLVGRTCVTSAVTKHMSESTKPIISQWYFIHKLTNFYL